MVLAETGEPLEELEYPDPGGVLAAQLPRLSEEDVGWLALAAAKVRAADRDRARAEQEAEDAAGARREEARRNAEELARVRAEHERGQALAEAAAEEGVSGAKKGRKRRKAAPKTEPE